mmetsp:Transcript_27343/g.56773  ORF Transcript_27343/g.56773 Transcript_27343/m.56773 type:complete len:396 (-) Transcript_27343:167-1354(-)
MRRSLTTLVIVSSSATWRARARVGVGEGLLAHWAHPLLLLAIVEPHLTSGSGGITDDERLLYSDGSWHRAQRKRIAFETSCYYTHEAELPYGCHRAVAGTGAWGSSARRAAQKSALLDLYGSTRGGRWRASDNWSQDTDPCWDSWYGVTCDEHGLVVALELADNGLRGELPASLGGLASLLRLDLSTTARHYHGHPNAQANRLHGALPSLAAATRLEEIEISGNELAALPGDLWQSGLTLRVLSASRNRLTALPTNLRRFVALHTLELGHNLIADAFPPDFGSLANLRVLQLEYNRLRGAITSDVKGMRRLRVFDVSHNPALAGQLPEDIIVEWQDQDYISVLNTSVSGYIASLCLDVPFCWKFMYDTHKDLTWATTADVPDIVDITIALAQSGR